VPLNHPTDSLRHSFLTCPHAGVWRKLTEGWAALNSRCRSASMVRTERATGENVIPDVGSRLAYRPLPRPNPLAADPRPPPPQTQSATSQTRSPSDATYVHVGCIRSA
jgi:hypothetical protein